MSLNKIILKGFLVFFFIAVCVSYSDAGFEAGKKRVLVLNSYHDGHPWGDKLNEGIDSALQSGRGDIEVLKQYMDATKGAADDEYMQRLYELYKYKFKSLRFDLVLATDNYALDFLFKFRDSLFPQVPVVFCGINGFDPSMLEGRRLYTGVAEDLDVSETVKLALEIHKEAETVIAIVDATHAGAVNKRELEVLRNGLQGNINLEIIENANFEKIIETVSGLNQRKGIVLLAGSATDPNGYILGREETLAFLSRLNMPVYSIWKPYLGSGIVGGVLTGGYAQGRIAGKIAVRILLGDDIKNIPVIRESSKQLAFDYNQLKRFGIDESKLPANSVLVNRKPSIIEQHRDAFLGLVFLIVFLSATVLALTLNIARRKKAEEELRRSESRYRAVVEDHPDLICRFVRGGILTFVNDAYCRYFGSGRDELLGRSFLEFVPEADRDGIEKNLSLITKDNPSRTYDHRVVLPNGDVHWHHWHDVGIFDGYGNPVEYQSVGRDITEMLSGQ
ncbi:MAG: PAS domain S-box protein [Nitrospirae bacterium]|nr:MAG: PAS domain S-box protein [Nitrospirota bacterium]